MEILDKAGLFKHADVVHKAIAMAADPKQELNIALKMQLIQLKNYMTNVNIQEITKDPMKFVYDSNFENIMDLINKLEAAEKPKPNPNVYIA